MIWGQETLDQTNVNEGEELEQPRPKNGGELCGLTTRFGAAGGLYKPHLPVQKAHHYILSYHFYSYLTAPCATMSAHPKTDLSIPKTQKVAIFEKAGGPIQIVEKPVVQESELKAGEVLVKVMVCV